MKYLLFVILILPISLSAQFNKGDKFIGGSLSIQTLHSPYTPDIMFFTKGTGITISPQIGFLLNEKLAFGGNLIYSSIHYVAGPDTSEATSDMHTYSIGLFLRRYYSINEKFLFSLTGNADYGRGKNQYSSKVSDDETKNYKYSISVYPSFIFFPSQKWGIEASIGNISYDHTKTIDSDNKTDTFGIGYGSFILGFAYYFQKINITIN